MRIAFLSDFHLGFSNKDREGEAFALAKAALSQALKEKPDLVVLTGDLFNRDVPAQEDLLGAFLLLAQCRRAKQSGLKISVEKGSERKQAEFSGVPVISIHGTHEFRGRDFRNALEVLDSAGFLIYIHAARAIVESEKEKIVFHGLGGVPEKKAKDALLKWAPQPVKGAKNILLLHQSFREFLPFDDEMVASLSIGDLPQGFDFTVNGHLHSHAEFSEQERTLIIPGSTIITQLKKAEAGIPKGFFIHDSLAEKTRFVELEEKRTFYYKKIRLENASQESAAEKVKEELGAILGRAETQEKMKPLVRISLQGTLAKGFSAGDIDLGAVLEKFSEKAVVSIASSFAEEDFKVKLDELKKLQSEKKSIAEMGLGILEKNLAETEFGDAFDVRRMFRLLSEGETEKAIEILSKTSAEEAK